MALASLWRALIFVLVGLISVQGYTLPQSRLYNAGVQAQSNGGGSGTRTSFGGDQTQIARGGSESQANYGASQTQTNYGGGQTQVGNGGSQSQIGRSGSETRPSSQVQTNYGGSRGQTNNGGSQGQTNNGGTQVYNPPSTTAPQGGRSGSLPTGDYSNTQRPVIDGSLLGLTCASNYSSEYHRNPENCTHFFRCAYGFVFDIGYCPEGTVFSTIISNCVWESDVDLNDCQTSAPSTGSREAVGASWQQQLVDLGASQISGFLQELRHRRR